MGLFLERNAVVYLSLMAALSRHDSVPSWLTWMALSSGEQDVMLWTVSSRFRFTQILLPLLITSAEAF
jgi:hypothetical protein